MYTTTLASAFAFSPASLANNRRTRAATLIFATGGILGWPFALALALPFVLEELFVFSGDYVLPEQRASWMIARWRRLFISGLLAGLIFVGLFRTFLLLVTYSLPQVPVVAIDSLAYGKLSIVPWNIVRYNVFGGSDRGPDLYGTSPWHFYIFNLILNFNVLVPFALAALPALLVTYYVDRQRLGFHKPGIDRSSPYTLLAIRLAPFYLWLGIFTLQAHKEERFMFPAYPLLCFNAAVTVYLVRGWQEVAFIKFTKSPYRVSLLHQGNDAYSLIHYRRPALLFSALSPVPFSSLPRSSLSLVLLLSGITTALLSCWHFVSNMRNYLAFSTSQVTFRTHHQAFEKKICRKSTCLLSENLI